MRRLLFLAAALACAAAPAFAAESFTRSLSADEFHRAGLGKLSPAERTYLDGLVQRRLSGVAAIEAQVSPVSPEPAGRRAVVVVSPGTRVVESAVESRIDGKFTGWEGLTVFRLQNGQRWQVANSDDEYWHPAVMNPRVRIVASSFGGYWMTVEEFNLRVRVKPLP